MGISRQERAAENELTKAFSNVMRIRPVPHRSGDCPSANELHSFVRGKTSTERREYLVAHLSSCDRCIRVLQKRRARQSMAKELTLVFAAAAVLVLAIWIGSQSLMPIRSQVATVDLRPFALTRGGAAVTAAGQDLVVVGKASRLRFILPAGSEGQYEFEILDGNKHAALMHVSGETVLQNHQVILELPMQSVSFQAGRYTMALRKQGHNRVFYPIVIK